MLPPASAPQQVVNQIAAIEAALDDVVNHGSDDELFTASYLQGHFAVVSRLLEMQPTATLEQLNSDMIASLQAAFDNKELEGDDAAQVTALWTRLLSQAQRVKTES
ncbi:YfcL family protein [Alteromonas sp. 1_MG-2023]|uniref:YfcL family protein n=1 Tax=Alteromonas sp. 1_MG-2023 TaxID=3062669 RepID=UPI0026E22036|nr:YfcL family protein [Alteromonas sp. 1_MG-2023]MDO6568717.1 YfcL family protein [Alteromonas sp. 1_MG-2023]